VSLVVRRITIAVLAAALAGAVLAVPALSAGGPAVVAKKKAKKCKKAKKAKKKKRKGCKTTGGGGGTSGIKLPGEATPSTPTPPEQPGAAPHMSSVGVAADPVYAGSSTTGTVLIDGAAPAGGQAVSLGSTDPSVSVPASVVVPAGQTSTSFGVNTTTGVAATSTLSGSIDTSTASTQLHVVDSASVSSVKLERQCFTFGPFASNRVILDIPAPSDTLVGLVSDDTSALTVPAGVTVPSGSNSAFFSVNAVGASAAVTVTASLGSSEATDTASVSDTEPIPTAADLSVDPDTVVAGQDSTATVTLDCEAPAAGTTVDLSADTGIGVPTSVIVPAGELSTTFNVTTAGTLDDGQYDITATVGAGTPVHATVTIDSSLPT
jgi:hypothetical protein